MKRDNKRIKSVPATNVWIDESGGVFYKRSRGRRSSFTPAIIKYSTQHPHKDRFIFYNKVGNRCIAMDLFDAYQNLFGIPYPASF